MDIGCMVIYGAGFVAHELVGYLKRCGQAEKIRCIFVTEKKGTPDSVGGIPVFEFQKDDKWAQVLFVVAVYGQKQAQIQRFLKDQGVSNVRGLTDHEISIITRENNYYFYKDVKPDRYQEELVKWFSQRTGKALDLQNPVTFNEKIQWLKLYGDIPQMTKLTDKWLVRDWVGAKIGEEYQVQCYGVWRDFSEIDFTKLPDQFILKCNHGCTWNMIVRDKSCFDQRKAQEQISWWLKRNYAYYGGFELQYRDIVPRIMAEEYLENEEGELYDYKFWCFSGKVEFIMFLSNREKGLKMDNYDRNWNHLPFTYDYPNSEKKMEKPEKLERMVEIAECLAAGFPFVRVDLYLLNDGRIKFGEMTFTPANGVCKWSDPLVDSYLGELIKLPVPK